MNLEDSSLAEIRSEVGQITHHEEDSADSVIDGAINRALAVAAGGWWPQLLRVDESGVRYQAEDTLKTFVSGDKYYPGPLQCSRVTSISYQSADGTQVDITTHRELTDRMGGLVSHTGMPLCAALVGRTIQFRAIPTDRQMTLQNTVGQGVNNTLIARLDYERSFEMVGAQGWENIEGDFLNGVTTTSSVLAPYGMKRLSIPAGWAGTLSLISGGTTYALVSLPQEPETDTTEAPHIISRPLYRLWPIPDTDYPMTVEWQRQPAKLTEDEDVPEIPVAPYLVLAAAADIFRSVENNGGMADRFDQKAAQMLRQIQNQWKGQERGITVPYGGSFTGQTGST